MPLSFPGVQAGSILGFFSKDKFLFYSYSSWKLQGNDYAYPGRPADY
ncbi:MAG: hypothetical protein CM1200mP24_07190 [Gammaproteobacteria bacterium]|nr:MAG: hypothetical protein CM1200mP24_07190 [Gammaproteobacteria bacterium]